MSPGDGLPPRTPAVSDDGALRTPIDHGCPCARGGFDGRAEPSAHSWQSASNATMSHTIPGRPRLAALTMLHFGHLGSRGLSNGRKADGGPGRLPAQRARADGGTSVQGGKRFSISSSCGGLAFNTCAKRPTADRFESLPGRCNIGHRKTMNGSMCSREKFERLPRTCCGTAARDAAARLVSQLPAQLPGEDPRMVTLAAKHWTR